MSLSFAWLSRLAVDEDHGLVSGLYGLSQGAGIVLGPAARRRGRRAARADVRRDAGLRGRLRRGGGAVLASLALAARVPDPHAA
jgi:hypothetical protein